MTGVLNPLHTSLFFATCIHFCDSFYILSVCVIKIVTTKIKHLILGRSLIKVTHHWIQIKQLLCSLATWKFNTNMEILCFIHWWWLHCSTYIMVVAAVSCLVWQWGHVILSLLPPTYLSWQAEKTHDPHCMTALWCFREYSLFIDIYLFKYG
jgi:hypothetical protein